MTGYLPGSAAKSLASMGMSFPAIRSEMKGSGPSPATLPVRLTRRAPLYALAIVLGLATFYLGMLRA